LRCISQNYCHLISRVLVVVSENTLKGSATRTSGTK